MCHSLKPEKLSSYMNENTNTSVAWRTSPISNKKQLDKFLWKTDTTRIEQLA